MLSVTLSCIKLPEDKRNSSDNAAKCLPFLTSIANRHVLINLGQQFRVIYFIRQSTYSGLAIRLVIYNASPKYYSLPRNKTHPVSQLVKQLPVLYG